MRYVCRVCSRSRRWGLQNTSLYEDQKTTLWGATHILLEVLSIKQWERTSLGCLRIDCEQSLFCLKICEQARHVSKQAELSREHRVVFALVLAPAPIVARLATSPQAYILTYRSRSQIVGQKRDYSRSLALGPSSQEQRNPSICRQWTIISYTYPTGEFFLGKLLKWGLPTEMMTP